jgi:uncharacterized DUF497 family protein
LPEEVEEVLFNDEDLPRMMGGNEGQYLVYGRTHGGRFSFIVWASKYRQTKIITVRDMTGKEKRFYPLDFFALCTMRVFIAVNR